MARGNKITVGLIDGNTISENVKPKVELLNELVKEGAKVEEAVKPALLISTVDYPVTIKYGDHCIRLTGRAREKIADWSKIGDLPDGIALKKV